MSRLARLFVASGESPSALAFYVSTSSARVCFLRTWKECGGLVFLVFFESTHRDRVFFLGAAPASGTKTIRFFFRGVSRAKGNRKTRNIREAVCETMLR